MSRSNVWREKRCRRASPSASALQISLATNAKLNAYSNQPARPTPRPKSDAITEVTKRYRGEATQ